MWTDKVYNVLKFFVQIILPALATLYTVLSAIWGLPDVKEVVATLGAVATFLGVTLHISSGNFAATGADAIGTISVAPNGNGSVLALHIDPHDVVGKDSITLQVVDPTPPIPPKSR